MVFERGRCAGVFALVCLAACGPEVPSETATDGTSSGGGTATTTGGTDDTGVTTSGAPGSTGAASTGTGTGSTSVGVEPGCDDGIAAPGELCFELIDLADPLYLNEPALADMNGDGHLDLVATVLIPCPLVRGAPLAAGPTGGHPGQPRDGAVIYQVLTAPGDGLGGFGPVAVVPMSFGGVGRPAVADFTGDGRPDLALGASDQQTGQVLLLAGDGAGGLMPPVASEAPFLARALAAGDLDGDGDVDLVAAGDGGLAALLGDGAGAFTPVVLADSAAYAYPVLGDFEGDGDLDFVVARDATIEVHLGAGDGTFVAGPGAALAGSLRNLAVLDPAKGDRPAVLVTTYEFMVGYRLHGFDIAEDGSLAPPAEIADVEVEHLAVGRFDGAPRPDVIGLGPWVSHAVLGEEPWPPAPVQLLERNFGLQGQPAVGDLNEDGVDDVVIPDYEARILLSRP